MSRAHNQNLTFDPQWEGLKHHTKLVVQVYDEWLMKAWRICLWSWRTVFCDTDRQNLIANIRTPRKCRSSLFKVCYRLTSVVVLGFRREAWTLNGRIATWFMFGFFFLREHWCFLFPHARIGFSSSKQKNKAFCEFTNTEVFSVSVEKEAPGGFMVK